METKKISQEWLLYMYNASRMANVCHTQKEFANFIGIDVTTLSKAMKGYDGYLTENLQKKIEKAFADHNIQNVLDNHGTVIHTQKNIHSSSSEPLPQNEQERIDKFLDLLKEKDVQMNRLLALMENMQAKH